MWYDIKRLNLLLEYYISSMFTKGMLIIIFIRILSSKFRGVLLEWKFMLIIYFLFVINLSGYIMHLIKYSMWLIY